MIDSNRILIANGDKLLQRSLYEMLCRQGYRVDMAEALQEAMERLNEIKHDVVIMDLHDHDNAGHLETIDKIASHSKVIVLTSQRGLEFAVGTTKRGAFDCLVKPVEDKKIISAIERALSSGKTGEVSVRPVTQKSDMYHGLVGSSQPMKDIYSIVERIANSRATVLLCGESGTGKRLIAHALHKADKKRKNKPFVEISCGGLPREIIESELFGHTKGAFTGAINDRKGRFELADGGTILLDDIDCLTLDLQVKLLRAIQHKEFERVGDNKTVKVDVRIIASTNQDMEKAIAEKKFREDLYYRLNVISIHIPPLRSRREDIPLLVNHFINIFAAENHKQIKTISPEILQVLVNYNWPGNIRQLENIVERAVILDTDNIIGREDLPDIILNNTSYAGLVTGKDIETDDASTLKGALEEPERVYILRALEEVDWNKNKAARKLGVNRTTLYNKLRKYNIVPSEQKK
ncbi:MAG: sigma-54 dependent transcriptional regulator [Candidatus Omnitrophica bacterium]|nr:sigma-54 dependent transcriptional regulator [Candidatus Omnitrophota bacterium]MBU4488849.1 sigma-54 dependent transcriptional regulator [Candidatus Omnitrophota bacterium]